MNTYCARSPRSFLFNYLLATGVRGIVGDGGGGGGENHFCMGAFIAKDASIWSAADPKGDI